VFRLFLWTKPPSAQDLDREVYSREGYRQRLGISAWTGHCVSGSQARQYWVNANGQLKMFDFGLAKRVLSSDKTDNGMYTLTGNTGSLRYMAPEVAKTMPYSLSVDVYSYGVLFWQLCSLSVPFGNYSCKMHADLVVGKGYRPSCDASWPESWGLLMSQCWDLDPASRPSFDHISKVINSELESWTLEGEDFETEEERNSEVGMEKIRARRGKSVIKIKARRDRHQLDVDTRLAKQDGPTEKKHDADVV